MIFLDIALHNAVRDDLRPIETRALVDTGSAHLCIGRSVQLQLGLVKVDERQVVLADGRTLVVDYVGAVLIKAFGRSSWTGALVLGEEVRLGSIALADLDLLIDLRAGVVKKHGDSPNIAVSGSLPQRNKAYR